MANLTDLYVKELEIRKTENLYRSHVVHQGAAGPIIKIDGRSVLCFCSNDYLGLANHPKILEALSDGAKKWGVGSGASHLICGHSTAHQQLEESLANFTNRPRALLFSTGYMANIGSITSLVSKGDTIFADRLNHASLIDGAVLSRAKTVRYRHTDLQDLESKLSSDQSKKKIIVSDGVFSMDGDIAPISDLVPLAERYNALLIIDDAHGFGVLGEKGGGIQEYFKLNKDQPSLIIGTLGKSFGTFGAFVVGSHTLIETLIQKARSYIYTTAMSPAIAYASYISLKIVEEEKWRREHLKSLIKRFRASAQQIGLNLLESSTPIQPLLIGDIEKALDLYQILLQKNIWISAIRPPTVPKDGTRLRITLSAGHSNDQVDYLLETLATTLPTMNRI